MRRSGTGLRKILVVLKLQENLNSKQNSSNRGNSGTGAGKYGCQGDVSGEKQREGGKDLPGP